MDLTPLPCVATSTSLHSLMISPDMAMYFFIKEKLDALEMFKVFCTEVEKKLGKVVKIVRFDRSGEYYGKHGDAGQQKGPFARYLQDNGIFAQYTMPGSPEQNGVVERRNCTVMEMKRSIMSRSNFPKYFWGEAIKTTTYILNHVPSKSVPNTPFELWTNRKPNLNHFKVWGCLAEVKIYDPSLKKTYLTTTRHYFIRYPCHSKGYRFYCSTRGTRVVEYQVANFLELDVAEGVTSQPNESVEPMDVISLPLPASDVNIDVRPSYSGIQQGVSTINLPTIEITPIVNEIPPVEVRRL